ncbi:hypothetical protein Ndes2526B_g05035 [Nannochloris sp. 'desiccata']
MLGNAALATEPLQLTNLRQFNSKTRIRIVTFCNKLPHTAAQWSHVRAKSSTELNLLRTAEQLNPQAPIVALETVPPYEEWHRHPELLTGCEPDSAPLSIALLLSGGVDSTLALHLLHAAGHHVTAYYLQIWFQEDFRNFWDACPWEEDLEYCRAACDRLGVELKVVPLSQQYWDRVVAHCISEVRSGRTPNPDVLCNSRVKFGAFIEHLEMQKEDNIRRIHNGGCENTNFEDKGRKPFHWDRIASGHYARIDRSSSLSEPRLALTPDAIKDQTYFLAHLSPSQLANTLFPLGNLTKPQVRALAAAAALPNQDRKDSQGICFLGKVRFSEFIKEHLGEWPGPIIEEESGQVLGYHQGFWFHTVGQRKGIPLHGGPCWTTETLKIDLEKPLQCKVRHGPNLYECTMEILDTEEGGGEIKKARIGLNGIDQGLAEGQYAVFYQNGYCLGCAVICSRDEGEEEEEGRGGVSGI